jgi:GNAT superfamily N-acetyltransferase
MRTTLGRIEDATLGSCSDCSVRFVDSCSPDFTALVSAFEVELLSRYPEIGDEESVSTPDFVLAVVAYRGAIPVGCGALRELESGVGEVKRVFVRPDSRGLGIARRVLGVLEEQGRVLGYSTLRLGSGVRQPEALALYESSGYSRIPLFGEYVEGGDLCACYEKRLGCAGSVQQAHQPDSRTLD